MKKMQLLLLSSMLSFAGSILADGTVNVWNRSNMPVCVNFSSTVNAGQWSQTIAPGAQFAVPYEGTLKSSFNVCYLQQGKTQDLSAAGAPKGTSKAPSSAIIRDAAMFGGTIGTSFSAPQSVIVYGDALVDAGQLLAKDSVAATADAGAILPASGTTAAAPGPIGQCLLPAGAVSRFAAFVYGTVKSGNESKDGAQPIIVQAFKTDGSITNIAAPAVVAATA